MQQEIFNRLELLHIKYTNYEHMPVFTVEEAYEVDATIDAVATKNLFLKDKKKNFFLISLKAQQEVCLKTVSKQVGAKGSLSFAREEQLKEVLNIKAGSVNPFCMLYVKKEEFKVKFFLQKELANSDKLGFHPMRNDMTTVISARGLKNLLNNQQISCNLIDF